jgi:indolepyruvate ferredoxin oxidoreductase beta subunit
MAEELGNIRVMNIILLGSVANRMGLGEIDWNEIIAQNVKKQFVEINQKAFELGYRS